MAAYKKRYPTKKSTIKPERYVPPSGWNSQFETVFNFIENGKNNGAIEAVAGAGKTTAIVESVIRYSKKNTGHKVLFVAFNVSIKEEGEKRLAGYPVDVLTSHGLGYKTIIKNLKGQFDVQGSNGPYMMGLVQNELGFEPEKKEDVEELLNLISKAKTCLRDDNDGLVELIDRFGITFNYPTGYFCELALKILNYTKDNLRSVEIAGYGKYAGKTFRKTIITFDDQIWLPVVKNWQPPQYDAIFVDEAQDLSQARRELIYRALKPGGRIFCCADNFQAIYGFAGADIDSFPTMINELNCTKLQLSYSWRCAKNVIAEAQKINPIITAAPNAPDGIVDEIDKSKLLDVVKNGDVILSRTNSPLVKLFFQLSRKQRKVKFIGRDYGRMLVCRINNWKAIHESKKEGPFTGVVLLEYNDMWLENQQKSRKGNMARLKDEHATIEALTADLSNSMYSTDAVKEMILRCSMFSPEEDRNADASTYITLSSTHRFKGLERDHVYALYDTYSSDTDEERNLTYVMITRARKHLTFVKKKDSENAD